MRNKISISCMIVGILLIAASVLLLVHNINEEKYAAEAADNAMPILIQEIEAGRNKGDSESTLNPNMEAENLKVVEIGGYEYIGYLSVPDLELELPVMSEWDYTRLKIAPCVYYGSVKMNNMVIAAHNYRCHFGRLSELEAGDAVQFTDMDGKAYTYEVGDIEMLPPTATEKMIVSDWDLTLYTCDYSGGSRVTVRCRLIDSN